jgi:hypothetical protein
MFVCPTKGALSYLTFVPLSKLNLQYTDCQRLGAFAKLRNTSIIFDMSVRPSVHLSVRMEQIGAHGPNFQEI